jgi:hypothetical protein
LHQILLVHPVHVPLPDDSVVAVDDERPPAGEGHDAGQGYRQPEDSRGPHRQMLVQILAGQICDRRFEDMGRGLRAGRSEPVLPVEVQSDFRLSAGQGELPGICLHAPAAGVVPQFAQSLPDLRVGQSDKRAVGVEIVHQFRSAELRPRADEGREMGVQVTIGVVRSGRSPLDIRICRGTRSSVHALHV